MKQQKLKRIVILALLILFIASFLLRRCMTVSPF